MEKSNIRLVAEGLTAYAIERQHGFERHQPEDAPPWAELRRFVSALEITGGDHRRQIEDIRKLLEDMSLHPRWWNENRNGLDRACDEAERALVRMTAQMPIRFTRVLLGGDAGPHWASGFVSGAATDAGAVRKTPVYQNAVRDYPEIKDWSALCTVYVGCGLPSALGATDASGFDLEIMNRSGERFLREQGVRCVGGLYQMTVSAQMGKPAQCQDGTAQAQTYPTM